jgi:hypothetical protein
LCVDDCELVARVAGGCEDVEGCVGEFWHCWEVVVRGLWGLFSYAVLHLMGDESSYDICMFGASAG